MRNGQYHYGESIHVDGETYKGGFLDYKPHRQGVATYPGNHPPAKPGDFPAWLKRTRVDYLAHKEPLRSYDIAVPESRGFRIVKVRSIT